MIQEVSTSRRRPRADAPRVVYVEDDPENWVVAELRLGARFQLIWAKTDVEACELFRAMGDEISAVLMDIELRGSALSGVELTRALRGQVDAKWPAYAQGLPVLRAPVFFLTAYAAKFTQDELRQAGGNRLLTKPVNFGQLSLALSTEHLRAGGGAVSLARGAGGEGGTVAGVRASNPELGGKLAMVAAALGAGAQADARALAVALAVVEMLPSQERAAPLVASVLRRSVAARLVGQALGGVDPLESAVVGLLLESGLLARAQHDLGGALEVAMSPSATRPVRERAAGEVEHPRRGAELLRELQAPESWREAVEQHHAPEPPASALGRVAWCAERLAAVCETGHSVRLASDAQDACASLNVALPASRAILEQLPGEVASLSRALGVRVDVQRPLEDRLAEVSPSLAELDDSYRALVTRLEWLMNEKNALVERLDQARSALATEAATDGLTGVANRRAFLAALQRDGASAARAHESLAVVMLDVDHFKRINDTLGHPVGDEVLKFLATTLQHRLRGGDLLARTGGEEFALVLPRTTLAEAMEIAERLRLAVAGAPATPQLGIGAVTASFGCAHRRLSRDVDVADVVRALISEADEALYQAKRSGRNRVSGGTS